MICEKDLTRVRSRLGRNGSVTNTPTAILKAIKSLERILGSVFRLGGWARFLDITADREVKVERGSESWVRVICVGLGLFRCQNCEMTFTFFDEQIAVTEPPTWCPICKAKFIPGGSIPSPSRSQTTRSRGCRVHLRLLRHELTNTITRNRIRKCGMRQ
jgi:hypothetical protein